MPQCPLSFHCFSPYSCRARYNVLKLGLPNPERTGTCPGAMPPARVCGGCEAGREVTIGSICSACTTRREGLWPWLPLPGKPKLLQGVSQSDGLQRACFHDAASNMTSHDGPGILWAPAVPPPPPPRLAQHDPHGDAFVRLSAQALLPTCAAHQASEQAQQPVLSARVGFSALAAPP